MSEVTVKKKAGQPAKYTPDFALALGKKLTVWMEEPNNFWLGTFAYENGINRQRLSELAEKFPEQFLDAYLCAKQNQENKLFLGALMRKMDAFTAHNALKNVSGWRDKTELDHSGEINLSLKDIVSDVKRRQDSNRVPKFTAN